MKPSKRQQAIYDEWLASDKNIVVDAVAGSGKSSVLLELVKLSPQRVLYVAFNKSIQLEIEEKLEQRGLAQGKAITMHSLGLSAIRNAGIRFKIENSKNYQLSREIMDRNKNHLRKFTWEEKLRTSYGLSDMNDISRQFLTDEYDKILEIAEIMDNHIFEKSPELMRQLWKEFLILREESYEKKLVSIDFLDMIYFTIRNRFYIPYPSTYLFLDEAQDFNLAQHVLINQLLEQGTIKKWIAVGDFRQSIYGFAGSYEASFDLFRHKPNTVELPLDICYRCPTEIIKAANEVYPVMQPFKEEPGIVGFVTEISEIQENSLVICRTKSPLIALYFELMAEGKPVSLVGEDIKGSILKFLKPYTKLALVEVYRELNKKQSEFAKIMASGNPSREDSVKSYYFQENFKNFHLIVKNLERKRNLRTVQDVINILNEMFQEEDRCIKLSSIHKSKGLEADVVYILNEFLIPHKLAKSISSLKQEQNLKYVARTRAKKEMYYLNMEFEDLES